MDLPYNVDAEKQVLANMLFSTDALVETFSTLNEDDFYLKEHQIIFSTIKGIFDANEAKIEPIALIDKLSLDGNLEKVGDSVYIFELVNSYNDITNLKYYINSVAERSILRKLILSANKIVNDWQKESGGDISNYISKVEKEISLITKKRRVEDLLPIGNAFDRYKQRVNLIRSGDSNTEGLATGYGAFDNLMLGFRSGEVNILAARPGVGKTALALNFLSRVSTRTDKPCVMFSLEMGVDSLVDRLLACKSGVPMRKIQTAMFDKREEDYINKAMLDLSSTNLFIDDSSSINTMQIRSKLNKLQSRFGSIGLVVVDYIGLITPDVKNKKDQVRAIELGEISGALKAMARDFNCPFLVLAQMNRNVEDRKGGKSEGGGAEPQLSDLRESGSIEQDADVVMFIHRPDYNKLLAKSNEGESTNTNPDEASDSAVKLIIAKHRQGSQGVIEFLFKKHVGQFIEIDKDRA